MYYFREDGKDCLKFYTDPSYFFELWYSEMKKDIENRKKDLKAKRVKKVSYKPIVASLQVP